MINELALTQQIWVEFWALPDLLPKQGSSCGPSVTSPLCEQVWSFPVYSPLCEEQKEEELILVRASMSARKEIQNLTECAPEPPSASDPALGRCDDLQRSPSLPISVIQWCCQIINWKCPVKQQIDARLCCNRELLKAIILSCAKSFTIAGRLCYQTWKVVIVPPFFATVVKGLSGSPLQQTWSQRVI